MGTLGTPTSGKQITALVQQSNPYTCNGSVTDLLATTDRLYYAYRLAATAACAYTTSVNINKNIAFAQDKVSASKLLDLMELQLSELDQCQNIQHVAASTRQLYQTIQALNNVASDKVHKGMTQFINASTAWNLSGIETTLGFFFFFGGFCY